VNSARVHTDGTDSRFGDQTTVRLPVQPDTFVQLDQVLDALRTEREAQDSLLVATKAAAPTYVRPDPARPRPLIVLLGCTALLALSVPWWVGVVAIVRWLGG
jgi:hypothetical protein